MSVTPGTKVRIKSGPAKGREVTVIVSGYKKVGVTDGSESQTVRGDLDVEVVK